MQSLYSTTISKQFAGTISLLSLVAAFSSGAQSNQYDNRGYNSEPIVSIFEDCGFRGERRDIAVGEFRNMRQLDFKNDRISSIQVPQELKAIIYEHDNFKGDNAKIGRDIRCFDKKWNDEVSSLKIEYRNGGQVYGGQSQNGRYGVNNRRNANNVGSNRYSNSRRTFNDGVTGKNVTQVTFDNQVLKAVGQRQWVIEGRGKRVVQYKEMSRDKNTVLLENNRTSQRIRIDLFTNDVTIVEARGAQKNYQINTRKAVAGNLRTQENTQPDTRIANRCFDYNVYTNGLAGGLRFSNGKDFFRFQKRGHKGRVCHRGELTVEMNKRDRNTDLTLEIDGRTFKFAPGEKETQFRANWYRKVIKLQVGQ